MTDIDLSVRDGDAAFRVVLPLHTNLVHPTQWWCLTGIELEGDHQVQTLRLPGSLVVVVGLTDRVAVRPTDLHNHWRAIQQNEQKPRPWPCAVYVPPRQNLTFSVSYYLTKTERELWAARRVVAHWHALPGFDGAHG